MPHRGPTTRPFVPHPILHQMPAWDFATFVHARFGRRVMEAASHGFRPPGRDRSVIGISQPVTR